MNYFIDGMNVFTNLMPGNLTSLAAISISGAYFLDEYLSFKYWKNIFKNCGLCNSDKKFPALINKLKNEIGTQFIFSLPPGICLSDVKNSKEELETALYESIKYDLSKDIIVLEC